MVMRALVSLLVVGHSETSSTRPVASFFSVRCIRSCAILLRMVRSDALEVNTEPEPPDREFAEAMERGRRRKGHAVIGPNVDRADGGELQPGRLLS